MQTYNPKKASSVADIIIEADADAAPPGAATHGKPGKKAPAQSKPGARKYVKKDPLVQKFQQAVMALYGPDAVGPLKDDEQWGPKTKGAYERLMADAVSKWPKLKRYPAQPTPVALNWGITVANALTKQKGAAAGLPQNLDVPYDAENSFQLRELSSAKAFLATLKARNMLEDVHEGGQEVEKAFRMLATLYNKLARDEQYRTSLTMNSGIPGIADKVVKVVFDTFQELYRMPGGKQTYESMARGTKSGKSGQPSSKETTVPEGKLDLSWLANEDKKTEKLDTPNRVLIAIRGLPDRSFLASPDEFKGLAVEASKIAPSLRGFWGKTVKPGYESKEQETELARSFLKKLIGRWRSVNFALMQNQGEILAVYKKHQFLKLRDFMQAYGLSIKQLGEAL
jgi:hypothetical protein